MATRLSSSALIRFGSLGIVFLMQVAISRSLGSERYGQFASFSSLAVLVALPCRLGFDVVGLRELAKKAERDPLHSSQLLTLGIGSTLAAGLVATVATSGIAFFQGGTSLLLLVGPLATSVAIARVSEGYLRGAGRTLTATWIYQVTWPVLTLLGVVAFEVNTAESALGISAGVSVAMALFCVFRLKAIVGFRKVRFRGNLKRFSGTSLQLMFISGSALIVGESDILITKLVVGSQGAGLYAASWKLSAMSAVPLAVVSFIYAPIFASAKTMDELRRALFSARKHAALAGGAVAMVLIVFAETALTAFGSDFDAGVNIVRILCISQLANVLAGPIVTVHMMRGGERTVAMTLGCTAVFNLAASLLLSSQIGILGVAVATAVSTLVWNIVLTWRFRSIESGSRALEQASISNI